MFGQFGVDLFTARRGEPHCRVASRAIRQNLFDQPEQRYSVVLGQHLDPDESSRPNRGRSANASPNAVMPKMIVRNGKS
jgi:hypothetical protein